MNRIEVTINGKSATISSLIPSVKVTDSYIASVVREICRQRWGRGTLTKVGDGHDYEFKAADAVKIWQLKAASVGFAVMTHEQHSNELADALAYEGRRIEAEREKRT